MTHHQPGLINWFSENAHEAQLSAFTFSDLCQLDLTGSAMGRNIINELLKNNELDIIINPSKETDKKLFQLKTDNNNILNYSNFQPLGLGFPIVKLKNPRTKEIYLTPLFIWEIQLTDLNTSTPSWRITHNQNDTIRLNYPFYRYVKNNFKIDLSKLAHSLLIDKKLNTISLSKICYELSGALGKKEDFFIENLHAIARKSEQNILCSGAISNFYEPLILSKPAQIAKLKDPVSIQHPFSISTLDPWQRKAFNKIWNQPHSRIHAGHGTGKSHILHYALINALSNGLSSLVVADSVGRIQKIRNELAAQGLDHLMLDITNPEKDLSKIVQALSFKSNTPKEEFEEPHFKYLVNRCLRHKDRLDTSFQVLNQGIFDKVTWPEIVGHQLSYNRIEKHELLDNLLDAKDFTFHPTEYNSLKEAVKSSEHIYKKVNNLKFSLHNLHPDIFLEKNKAEAKSFVAEQLDLFLKKFNLLHHRYILKIQDYARDLSNAQETFFQEASLKIEELKDLIEDNRILYENDFEDSGLIQTGKLKVYGVFSGKHKNILQERNLINEKFRVLRVFLSRESSRHFESIEQIDAKSISKVIIQLNELEDQLHHWHSGVPERLQEELQRLNTKSVHASLDYEEQINELEYTLDMNIEELNTSGLFLHTFQNKMLTIPMRQLFIQDIIDQLKNTKNHLKDFSDFYDWQRHWLLLPDIHRKLLTGIIKLNPQNWLIAFKSWYFYQRLKADYHFKMPKNDKALIAFESDIQKLQRILPTQIRQVWKHKAIDKKTSKAIANLSLHDLFDHHFQTLSQQFPVIVTTTQVAARLVKNKAFNFNLGFIFLSDKEINDEDFAPELFANRTVLFTNKSQEKQTGTTSLLNNVHKAMPYPIFDFVNHFCYQHQKSLINFSSNNNSTFSVKKVSGQFRQEVNIAEAEAIIDELIKVAGNTTNEIPKIAIVCSTFEQRNFIGRKLLHLSAIERSNGAPLKKLMARSIGIFHMKELRMNNYDSLFFSLGIQRFSDPNNEVLNFLNNKSGIQSLENLMSANFSKINIYHSVSATEIDSYSSHKTKKSIRLLALWIKYASTLTTRNTAEKIEFFDKFKFPETKNGHKLTEEIANELSPYIGQTRIRLNYNFNGLLFPLLILPTTEKAKSIVIINDACLHPEHSKSHLWNIEILRFLKNQGLSPVCTWSANWFENPALEARRLASAVLKMDKDQKLIV